MVKQPFDYIVAEFVAEQLHEKNIFSVIYLYNMTSYMNTELNNQIVKSMMLNNNCNHVSGDDTNGNGYRLIVKEDDECECNVVRNLRSDNNIGIRINSRTNSLFLYDRKDVLNKPKN